MNDLRTAAQQALEALELLARYENPSTKIQVRKPRDGGSIVTMYPHKVASEAATALRAAIEQANEFNPDWDALSVMVEEQQRMAKRIEELEAQQKPWVKTYAGGKPNYTVPEEQEPGVTLDASAPLVVQPHPAFKKWQGLTEAEKVNVAIDCGCADVAWMDFADAIEAKLKEKNT